MLRFGLSNHNPALILVYHHFTRPLRGLADTSQAAVKLDISDSGRSVAPLHPKPQLPALPGDVYTPLAAAGPSPFSAITCLPQGGSLPSYLCACGHSPQLKGTHHQLPLIIYYYTSICYINLYIFCNESVQNISFNQ